MSENERRIFSDYIESNYGIKMSEAKKPLLTGRLTKRLNRLGLNNFSEYFSYITSPEGKEEHTCFVDLISTHETSFFRENAHYVFLNDVALPALLAKGVGLTRDLRVLSAACSTGQEGYSAAFTIEEFIRLHKLSRFEYSITGTDISAQVLATALRGVYSENLFHKVPAFARKYFMRSKDSQKKQYRVVPEIREKMQFMLLNLLSDSYPFDKPFDIVFCRNVMIYFDRETRNDVAKKICKTIAPGGYFLVGHSESLIGLSLPLSSVASATYVKR